MSYIRSCRDVLLSNTRYYSLRLWRVNSNCPLVPDAGSPESDRLKRAREKVKDMEETTTNPGRDRKRRQTLPNTTYTVQLYMIVDYYLFKK